MHFTDSNNGYAVVSDTIFKTTDGGSSWTSYQVQAANWNVYRIKFSDANTGYAIGVDRIWTIADAGKTWTLNKIRNKQRSTKTDHSKIRVDE